MKNMMLKQKLMYIFAFVMLCTIIITNVTGYKLIYNLVHKELTEDLISYSSLGMTSIDYKYPGDWAIIDGYYIEAISLSEMVSKIEESTLNLSDAVKSINDTIEEISIATEDGAKGTMEIAEKSENAVYQLNNILEQTKNNNTISLALDDTVKYFIL